MRETQKVERFALPLPSFFPALFCISSELDPACFVWMEFQPRPPLPFPEDLQRTVRFRSVLEAEDAIIGILNDDVSFITPDFGHFLDQP